MHQCIELSTPRSETLIFYHCKIVRRKSSCNVHIARVVRLGPFGNSSHVSSITVMPDMDHTIQVLVMPKWRHGLGLVARKTRDSEPHTPTRAQLVVPRVQGCSIVLRKDGSPLRR